jgi:hypothetical protein
MAMNMQTFDDDFENIPTTPKTTTGSAATAPAPVASAPATPAPATPAAAPKATPPAAKAAVEEDEDTSAVTDNESLDTDFDDEKVYARPGQLNQCRPEKGKAARFSFVPKEWIAPQTTKGHFIEIPGKDGKIQKQRIRCLTPMGNEAEQQYCCTTVGKDGEISVVALVVRYTNADATTGKYEKDAQGNFPNVEFEIQFVRLSQFNMRQIKKLPDEDSNPFKIDIVMTHSEGRAFGYEFNRKSNVPRWTLDPQVAAAVKSAASRFLDGKALRSKLGQKMNEIEWKALLSGKKVANDATLGAVDEL